jgi:molybdopterin-guanine dinucleotide biosynthesis protein A
MRGVVLAGGGATRYGGRPKGLERVGGVRILDRVVEAMLDAFGGLPLLVANAPDAAGWRPDLTVVPDVRPGMGALGGLYTAVVAGPAPVVVAAWDMPFISAGLLAALAAGLDGADACLPESGSRRGLEPLCAAYGPACRPAIERALEEGDLRAIGFHRHIRLGILPLDEVRRFGEPGTLFRNVNSPDELAEAEAAWQARGSSPSSDARTPERPR